MVLSILLLRYKRPITKHNAATPIGYQSPTKGSLVKVVDNNVAIKGTNPPNTPLPIWYGKLIEVYRIFVGNNSTKKAATGPYTIVTKMIIIQIRKINFHLSDGERIIFEYVGFVSSI